MALGQGEEGIWCSGWLDSVVPTDSDSLYIEGVSIDTQRYTKNDYD